MRSLFEIACERCNSNDGKSACEAVVGELRAKLLRLVAISPQVADSPPARGGNCVIRTTTRRRHTASQFLMLQNPHRHRCGGCRRGRRAWLRCPWAVAGPGRASSRRAERSSRRGRRAGGPPPTGTPSSPDRRKTHAQPPSFTATQQHAEKSYEKYESFIGSS